MSSAPALSRPSRLRVAATSLALLAAGTFIGITSQQLASADVTSGDRPILVPIEPCRLADTRPAPNQVGPRAVPLGAGDVHTVDAQEADTPCTGIIPTDASALSLNVTALGATELSYLTIWAGGDRPLAASLNPAPGQPPVPNAVTTQLSVDQEFEIYNNAGSVQVVIDVNGYYANHNHDDRYVLVDDLPTLQPRIQVFEANDPETGVVSNGSDPYELSLDVELSAAGTLQVDVQAYLETEDTGGCGLYVDGDKLRVVASSDEDFDLNFANATAFGWLSVDVARAVEIDLRCSKHSVGTMTIKDAQILATFYPD